ncbi:hypothetical protein MGYG_08302 [Nannizzia gypsea CBS 118893]|uniref:RNA polymerase I-specific transcription initiation factor rrn11 n=1 Tax=Arthroderma gypseum (strain ATCC MYA-4604 / CBS 118893) TaxID=535722 RepID=E4V6A8_ARTGP|nr:hypothetical protein MGYG_08302 [Nannizzia gypsea CBS 118893]EFR05291.1 hypothetical protein MGYG_08302 [Nannizzia gypsea CBS 118893]
MSRTAYSDQAASSFALPLPLWQQPVSYRTAKYEHLKQRGRFQRIHDGDSNEELDQEHSGQGQDGTESVVRSESEAKDKQKEKHRSTTRVPLVLSPGEAHQYRISGLPVYRELPGGQFPHEADLNDFTSLESDDEFEGDEDGANTWATKQKRTKTINSRQRIETDLSQLNPPIYLAGGNPTKKNALRLRHLSVVTTILHRCLMEGDYLRAGRALGLILRDNFGGHPVDVRNSGRWATGAEILLWTGSSSGPGNRGWFTRAGFERAKEYYERLIIQYQYRKAAPNALSPLHFYPAMFGLWISVSQEESRLARDSGESVYNSGASVADSNEYPDPSDPGARMDDYTQSHDKISDNKTAIIAARVKELEEAQQIARQMDELLVSPPFSDSHELLRLRGMVSQWIGDLYLSSVLLSESEQGLAGIEDEFGDSLPHDDRGGNARLDAEILRIEIDAAKEKRLAEIEKAKSFFNKAQARLDRTRSSGI